ncbi:YjbQ family protein [bacterium]|nr:YjbQ family protein [bacterium]
MTAQSDQVEIRTCGRGLHEVTDQIVEAVKGSGITDGLCTAWIRHTSASLIVCENADPDVLVDLETFLADLVPDGDPRFVHRAEGPDDMPAHVRSVLTATSLAIPIADKRLVLGTWQGVFVYEHRHKPHQRKISLSLIGD